MNKCIYRHTCMYIHIFIKLHIHVQIYLLSHVLEIMCTYDIMLKADSTITDNSEQTKEVHSRTAFMTETVKKVDRETEIATATKTAATKGLVLITVRSKQWGIFRVKL